MTVVLIIEDDADVADTIQACIHATGYTGYLAETGERGLELCQQLEPDIIVLDLMLPGMDGIEVCTHVRRLALKRDPYILMLTARRGQTDEFLGRATGADDYMTKPFSPDMLILRLRGLLRRELRHADHAVGADAALIQHQFLRLHQTHRRCSVRASLNDDWVELVLSAVEFDLLAKLAQQPGHVYPRSQLLDDIWGLDHSGDDHTTVDSCIKRLRKVLRSKLRVPEGVNPLVKTVRRVGYKFEDAID
ncbi:response regulator transcription factor [Leptolyngbya sp. CCNP1308]|uniref:response regulator transcription factor n=1 Tax=Leptolyngbya sp. CCNP1308 TaxID=3110255 RepID=UPI002B216A41|nr:response regulator transcription factor [Leptolyngbya sp. CCNP1308]MEA5451806.1 response regulator transcription factor [Leptolyngbya sp. CCNP1308]